MKVRGGQIVRRQTKQRSPETTKEKRMPRLQTIEKTPVSSSALPRRSGLRPKTIRGPLHVQCTGHGDPNLLHHIIQEVLDWPQIESTAPFVGYQDTVSIRLRETACTDNASAFISGREFARVLLKAPTIYLALPLVWAHWAIVRGWAEPHYLTSYGLIPAGVVVLYTPRDEGERAVCYALFAESYNFCLQACFYRQLTAILEVGHSPVVKRRTLVLPISDIEDKVRRILPKNRCPSDSLIVLNSIRQAR